MTPPTTLLLTLLPLLTTAHFSILHPPTTFLIAGEPATTPPCGYSTPPDTSTPPHPFLISGSQIALSTHGKASWHIQYTLDTIPTSSSSGGKWSDLVPPLKTEGDGNFCIPNAKANVATTTEGGTRGWISVRGEMEEGVFWGCAVVRFVNVATLEFPLVCGNGTGVRVGFADGGDGGDDEGGHGDGDDDTTTGKTGSATSTSTRFSNSTMTSKITTGASSTSAGSTTLTSTSVHDNGGDEDSTISPEPPVPTDNTTQGPGGPSTITSTSFVVPTDETSAAPTGTGTPTPNVPIAGAGTQAKGSPLGMAGFSAVVLGAGILCAGLML